MRTLLTSVRHLHLAVVAVLLLGVIALGLSKYGLLADLRARSQVAELRQAQLERVFEIEIDAARIARNREADPIPAARGRLYANRAELDQLQSRIARHSRIDGTWSRVWGVTAAAGNTQITEVESALPLLLDLSDRLLRAPDADTTNGLADKIASLTAETLYPAYARLSELHRQTAARYRSMIRRTDGLVLWGIMATIAAALLLIARPIASVQRQKLAAADEALKVAVYRDPVTRLPNAAAVREHLTSLPPETPLLVVVFEIAPAIGLQGDNGTAIALGVAETVGQRLQDLKLDALFLGHAQPDRFCALFAPGPDEGLAQSRIRDLEALIDEPVQLQHRQLRLTFRAGIALKRPNRPAVKALEDAGLALDSARHRETSDPLAYSPQLRRDANEERRLSKELRVALMSGEVRPFFQPQINLATGEIAGMEALARWHHPRRGLLSPGIFLPLAERTGLDEPLGEIMMRMGFEALKRWDEMGYNVRTVGINTARSQLSNPRFVEFVRWELDRFKIEPNRLVVEVLENIYAASDDDLIVRNLAALADLGVQIDLDDFGTGAASITGIRRFHANRIKIDRSYIRNIDTDFNNQTLVTAIVHMARNLGLDSLAEGVETEAERRFLESIGCGFIQGFGVAKPMSLDDSARWIAGYASTLGQPGDGMGRSATALGAPG